MVSMAERRLRAVPPSPAEAGRSRARARKQPESKPLGPPPELLRAAEKAAERVRLGGIYAPISASRAEAAGALISPEPSSPKPILPTPKPVQHHRFRRILELRFWPMTNLRRFWRILIAFATSFVVFSCVVYLGPVHLNPPAQLQTAFLTDIDGKVLGEIRPEQNRVVLDIAKIPKVVQNAFVAAEDERFRSHPGVDFIAIVRAIGANARGDREGASTITQQYVKNNLAVGPRTLWRKLREAILAVRVDRKYAKGEILERYLNTIYLGNGAYGVEAASRLYFGHGIFDYQQPSISLAEAATLAGVTANPTRWDPRSKRKEPTRERRDYVLGRMRTLGMISASQMAEAQADPKFRIEEKRPGPPAKAPGFQDWLRAQLLRELGDKTLYTSGLRIKTSLDLDLQDEAENAIKEILNRPGDPQAAVVTIDVATGGVRVMVGGPPKTRLGEYNLATQARRQSGSAFKPFVLAAALEQGKTLNSTYRAPGSIRLKIPGGVWKVSNYDHRGRGRLPLRAATAYSVNTVFAQLILDVGADEVVDAAHRAGITSKLSAVPSLALGTSGVSALEMASAFATFAREGQRLRPTGISEVRDRKGTLIAGGERQGRELMAPDVANTVLDALRTVVRSGTGRPARIAGYTAWGKTGTTEDHADAWFVGGVGGTVTAVWVGHPSGRKPMRNVHGIDVVGGSFPAQIWKRVMTKMLNKYKPEDDSFPKDPVTKKTRSAEPIPSEQPSEEPSEEPLPTPAPTPTCILGVLCR
jgi:membrane peptidoglycan carboxypeptidase